MRCKKAVGHGTYIAQCKQDASYMWRTRVGGPWFYTCGIHTPKEYKDDANYRKHSPLAGRI